MTKPKKSIRRTRQIELPVEKQNIASGYDIYPAFTIGSGLIQKGFDTLAEEITSHKVVKLDGYVGIFFDSVRQKLDEAFQAIKVHPQWINVATALKNETAIDEMIAPFLGGEDPVFGKLATSLTLHNFFDKEKLEALSAKNSETPVIFYGIGAALVPAEGKIFYFDISKNEIQYRSRAKSVVNLGASTAAHPKAMYKRFYFVDWVVLNKHKNTIKNKIDYLVDGQRSDEITWITAENWKKSIKEYVKTPVRVRPWFEPGAWGGHWIEKHIKGLAEDVINYAWSFELIVPENGLIFESSGLLLEFSFDFLMYYAGDDILGEDFKTYGYELPIRFDFLDTFDGGNLSIQCHPQKEYMQKHFGEKITQEETYYILDRKDKAQVYLGFQEDVEREAFQTAMKNSNKKNEKLEITDYVQAFDTKKHDLYLIPPGTIHSSGKDNLVLEISSTPYIYTFKMYDWLRLDLDGKPRPINIERGMDNLVFERSGSKVTEELIAAPTMIDARDGWELEHLPTHIEHLYDIHRYTIKTKAKVKTDNRMHILSLVEGNRLKIKTKGSTAVFHYAESFVIPAAVEHYTIENPSDSPIKVLKAFIK